MYWYYMTRNRLIFNKKFNKTISYKIYYLLTMTIKLIRYLVLRDKTALSGSVSGIVDFFKGIEAKRS